MKNQNDRTLAYKSACLIENEELTKIGGGAVAGTTLYTSKQTFDQYGNWDVGADIQWD